MSGDKRIIRPKLNGKKQMLYLKVSTIEILREDAWKSRKSMSQYVDDLVVKNNA